MRRLVQALFVATLTLLLATSPWPYGSRLPWAALAAAGIAILVGGVGHALLLYREGLQRTSVDAPALAFLAWTGLQWGLGATVYPFATSTDWLKILGVYLAFRMSLVVASNVRLRYLLAGVVLVMLLVVGSHALIEHYVWSGGQNLPSESPFGGTYPWGPFNNRNHFAGYALPGLGLALGLVLLRGSALLRLLAAGALAIGSASLLGSLSRSGILAFGIAATGALVVGWRASRRRASDSGRHRSMSRVVAVVLLVAAAAAVLGGLWSVGGLERIGPRLATLADPLAERSTRGRLQIWRDTLPMLADRPIMGFGLGTYVWAHMSYRTPVESTLPQHAHNEYLELTVETGVVGALLAAWMLWGLIRGMWSTLAYRAATNEASILLGCLTGWSAILVYSLLDFPTVALATDLVLAVLAGIGLACGPSSFGDADQPPDSSR